MQPLFRASDLRLAMGTELAGKDIHRILICRPNHRLGNLLLLTPLVSEIQRLFPDADVDIVLAGEHAAELFRTFPNVKHIYKLSRRMVRHPVALARTAARIRRAHYDLAIDPCEASQSSRLLAVMAKPSHMIGTPRSPSGRRSLAVDAVPRHMAQLPVYLLRESLEHGSSGPGQDFPGLDIRLSADERQHGRKLIYQLTQAEGTQRANAVIGVFAEATGAKNYGVDWWRRFIGEVRVQHADFAIVEIAPPDGHPRIAANLPCFSSTSPREVASVISSMTCFVSADCGVMHLASASGIPTIGLFSVSDPSQYAPYARGSRGLLTTGKTPEEVARVASGFIETLTANDRYAAHPGPGQPVASQHGACRARDGRKAEGHP